MANKSKPKPIYVVADKAPAGVFYRQDLAKKLADDTNLNVYNLTATTITDVRRATREAALQLLTPEQRAALGLSGGRTRARKPTPENLQVAA